MRSALSKCVALNRAYAGCPPPHITILEMEIVMLIYVVAIIMESASDVSLVFATPNYALAERKREEILRDDFQIDPNDIEAVHNLDDIRVEIHSCSFGNRK